MMAMDRPKLSGKEAVLIEAARRELAARGAAGQAPDRVPAAAPNPPVTRPAPAARPEPPPAATMQHRSTPAAGPDAAARLAALMQIEQQENFRRRKRLRQFGIVIPAVILIAATLWVVIAILRYARM
jgi:hypothetical protein